MKAPASGVQAVNKLQLLTKLFVCADSVCKVVSPSLTFYVKCDDSASNVDYQCIIKL